MSELPEVARPPRVDEMENIIGLAPMSSSSIPTPVSHTSSSQHWSPNVTSSWHSKKPTLMTDRSPACNFGDGEDDSRVLRPKVLTHMFEDTLHPHVDVPKGVLLHTFGGLPEGEDRRMDHCSLSHSGRKAPSLDSVAGDPLHTFGALPNAEDVRTELFPFTRGPDSGPRSARCIHGDFDKEPYSSDATLDEVADTTQPEPCLRAFERALVPSRPFVMMNTWRMLI